MRVLALTPDYPPARGGIQLLVHRVLANLPDAEVRVVAPGAPGAAQLDAASAIRVRRVPAFPGPSAPRQVALNVAGLIEAVRFRPDVVLSAHIVASPAARVLKRVLRIPYVQYLYASEVAGRPGIASGAVRHADAVVAISRHTREIALRAGADERRVHTITPGVDLPEAATSAERNGKPTIVTVARLGERYKGHDVVIRALPLIRVRVPDARWVVVGGGPLSGALAELAAASGQADAIEWAGVVSDEERDAWLRRADLLVMASRVQPGNTSGEGFGIALIEAGAHGVPVIAGDAGGARDAVVDGRTGLLVDPSDHVALADAAAELLQDRERALRMGVAGAEWAAGFSWQRIAEQLRAVLAGVAR